MNEQQHDRNRSSVGEEVREGIRVAGARTLSSDPLCRYVNVRRLLNMIEEGICEDTPWTVFEPNGPELWRQVDGAVRGLLDRLWRRGMLDGASATDASGSAATGSPATDSATPVSGSAAPGPAAPGSVAAGEPVATGPDHPEPYVAELSIPEAPAPAEDGGPRPGTKRARGAGGASWP